MANAGTLNITTRLDTKGINRGIQGLRKSLRSLTSTTQGLNKAMKGVGGSSSTLGLNKVASSLGSVATGASTATTGIAGLAAGIAGPLAAGIVVIGAIVLALQKVASATSEAIALASDLQEVDNVITQSFGHSSKVIEDFSKTAIKQFGISELSAKQFTGRFGAALSAMNGITKKQAADISVTLTKLSADMASFQNTTTEVTSNALFSGIISGETEPLKRFGILLGVAELKSYALSQGIKKSWDEMTQEEKVLLRLSKVMEVTNAQQGDFLRTQGSWANQSRILHESFQNIKTSMGQLMMKVLLPGLKTMVTIVSRISDLSTKISGIIVGAKETNIDESGLAQQFKDSVEDSKESTTELNTTIGETEEALASTGAQIDANNKSANATVLAFDKLNKLADNSASESFTEGATPSFSIGEEINPADLLDIEKPIEVSDLVNTDTAIEVPIKMDEHAEEVLDVFEEKLEKEGRVVLYGVEYDTDYLAKELDIKLDPDKDPVPQIMAEIQRRFDAGEPVVIDGYKYTPEGLEDGLRVPLFVAEDKKSVKETGEKVGKGVIEEIRRQFKEDGTVTLFGVELDAQEATDLLDLKLQPGDNAVEKVLEEIQRQFDTKGYLEIKGIRYSPSAIQETLGIEAEVKNVVVTDSSAWERFKKTILDDLEILGEKIGDFGDMIIRIFDETFGISENLEKAKEDFENFKLKVSIIATAVGKVVGDKFKEVGTSIGTSFENAKTKVGNTLENISTKASEVGSAIGTNFESMKTSVITNFNNIGTKAGEMVQGIGESVSTFTSNAIEKASTMGTSIKDTLHTLGEKAADVYSNMGTNLSNTWGNIKDNFSNAGTWFMTNVSEPIGNTFDNMGDGMRDNFNTMVGYAEDFFNFFLKGINAMIDGINSIEIEMPEILGGDSIGFNIGNIPKLKLPRLAQGAVIPPNKEFMAILGDQKRGTNIETPLATMEEAFRRVMGDLQINNNVTSKTTTNLVLDGEVIGTSIRDRENAEGVRF